jgi:hypothetical protein
MTAICFWFIICNKYFKKEILIKNEFDDYFENIGL